MTGQQTQPHRVELYSRTILSEQVRRRYNQVAARLSTLARNEHFGEVETINWRQRVPVEEDCFERYHYDLFETWATETDVSLEPFFDTRQCYSKETGERGTFLVMPVMSLAIYRDDALQTVYPHTTANGSQSVMNGLEMLETSHNQEYNTESAVI